MFGDVVCHDDVHGVPAAHLQSGADKLAFVLSRHLSPAHAVSTCC